MVLLLACSVEPANTSVIDADGDRVNTADDCDDGNATVYPGADEVWYDGVDQNCDGNDGDRDEDGWLVTDDCDDDDASINPDAEEIWYDGIDQNCDNRDDDQDEDGFGVAEDCDDEDASINPEAIEDWYDGIDQDCDGNDDDQDEDGFVLVEDCDDEDASVNPYATEVWYDGIDQDCDGRDDDRDEDSYEVADDCDDEDATANPGGTEVWYDGVDQDCDGRDDDQDEDGYVLADDCDDEDAMVNPGAEENCTDPADEDCDGNTDCDLDDDGHDDEIYGGDDCDDEDASVNPDGTEVWYDGVDQDCDGDDDCDADDDGVDDRDTGEDTADSGTGDTATDDTAATEACGADDGTYTTCAEVVRGEDPDATLSCPWTVDGPEDVKLAYAELGAAVELYWDFEDDASSYGCPIEAGWVYTGGCSTPDGMSYEGTVTRARSTESGITTDCYDFDGFEVSSDDGSFVWQATGSRSSWGGIDIWGYDWDLVTSVRGGEAEGLADGERSVRGTAGYYIGSILRESIEAVVHVSDLCNQEGDFYLDVSTTWDLYGCDSEYAEGTMELTGDATGTLTWDGDTACDGCGAFDLDGVAGDPYCE